MKKKTLFIIIVVLLVLGAAGAGFMVILSQERSRVEEFEYSLIDMQNVADGIFEGEASTLMVSVAVSVEVFDNAIASIRILQHDNGFGGRAEAIIYDMVALNSHNVDAVSGATISSEVIRQAVYQALRKGL